MLFKKQNKRKTKLLVLMPVWSVLHLICKEKEKENKQNSSTKQFIPTVPETFWLPEMMKPFGGCPPGPG